MIAKRCAQFERLKGVWVRLQQAYIDAQLTTTPTTWGTSSAEICSLLRTLNGEFQRDGGTQEGEGQALYALSLRLLDIRRMMHEVIAHGVEEGDVIFVLHEEIEERVAALEADDTELRWED